MWCLEKAVLGHEEEAGCFPCVGGALLWLRKTHTLEVPAPAVWSPGQTFDQSSETWRALCRVLTLCNRAAFKSGQDAVPVPKVRETRGFRGG